MIKMKGIIDNVKVRIRTHNPNEVIEREFNNIVNARIFMRQF